ncbi:hypothetical protein BY996DRAFT_6426102 [Phakopsora pachyrhizi]|nr:hypothetical protein BY996DRAFT_6426102 [Phakopsora pachyrhizi]
MSRMTRSNSRIASQTVRKDSTNPESQHQPKSRLEVMLPRTSSSSDLSISPKRSDSKPDSSGNENANEEGDESSDVDVGISKPVLDEKNSEDKSQSDTHSFSATMLIPPETGQVAQNLETGFQESESLEAIQVFFSGLEERHQESVAPSIPPSQSVIHNSKSYSLNLQKDNLYKSNSGPTDSGDQVNGGKSLSFVFNKKQDNASQIQFETPNDDSYSHDGSEGPVSRSPIIIAHSDKNIIERSCSPRSQSEQRAKGLKGVKKFSTETSSQIQASHKLSEVRTHSLSNAQSRSPGAKSTDGEKKALERKNTSRKTPFLSKKSCALTDAQISSKSDAQSQSSGTKITDKKRAASPERKNTPKTALSSIRKGHTAPEIHMPEPLLYDTQSPLSPSNPQNLTNNGNLTTLPVNNAARTPSPSATPRNTHKTSLEKQSKPNDEQDDNEALFVQLSTTRAQGEKNVNLEAGNNDGDGTFLEGSSSRGKKVSWEKATETNRKKSESAGISTSEDRSQDDLNSKFDATKKSKKHKKGGRSDQGGKSKAHTSSEKSGSDGSEDSSKSRSKSRQRSKNNKNLAQNDRRGESITFTSSEESSSEDTDESITSTSKSRRRLRKTKTPVGRSFWTKEQEKLLVKEVQKNYIYKNCMAKILDRHGKDGTKSQILANRTSAMLKDKAVNLSTKWRRERRKLSEKRKKAFERFPAKKIAGLSSDNECSTEEEIEDAETDEELKKKTERERIKQKKDLPPPRGLSRDKSSMDRDEISSEPSVEEIEKRTDGALKNYSSKSNRETPAGDFKEENEELAEYEEDKTKSEKQTVIRVNHIGVDVDFSTNSKKKKRSEVEVRSEKDKASGDLSGDRVSKKPR